MITALLATFPRNHSFLIPDYISAQSPHQAKSEIRINEILNKPRPNKFKLGKSKTSNPIGLVCNLCCVDHLNLFRSAGRLSCFELSSVLVPLFSSPYALPYLSPLTRNESAA